MARGELYLESPNGAIKLHLAHLIVGATLNTCATHGGIQGISRTLSKNPIVIPVPDQEPIGIDINMIESDTFRINTTWFDGIANGSTYASAEAFFLKTGWSSEDKMKPYRFQMGERTYYVMLTTWTADLTGGWGDTIPVSINLAVVASTS